MSYLILSVAAITLTALSIYFGLKYPNELGPMYPDDQFYKYLTEDKLKTMCSVNTREDRHE